MLQNTGNINIIKENIVHSDMREDGTVKGYIETSDEKDGFHNMTCYLPTYKIEDVNGYSEEQVEKL